MRLLIQSEDSLNNFDAIRLMMALGVIWSHSFALALPQGETVEPISILTNGHYNAGNIAVMVFFAISGFLICESRLKSKSLGSFLGKRVRRIYPGYMAASTIGAFVVVPLFSTAYDFSLVQIAKTVGGNLLLQNYVPPSSVFARNYSTAVNGSLWSIPFEFWCYLAIAGLGIAGLLREKWAVSAIIISCMAARAAFDILDKKPGLGIVGQIFGWPYLWVFILPCFLMGTLFFLLKHKIPRHPLILISLIGLLLLLCYSPVGDKYQRVSSQLIFPLTLTYSTFYFAFTDRIKLRYAAAKGDFSYGTYLFAYPIQQMLISPFILPFPLIVLLSIVLSLGAGFLSWHLVEKWFLPRRVARGSLIKTEPHPVSKTPS
jgi:peptidoglycan/LPS O-acetylase OafA/YrhL